MEKSREKFKVATTEAKKQNKKELAESRAGKPEVSYMDELLKKYGRSNKR